MPDEFAKPEEISKPDKTASPEDFPRPEDFLRTDAVKQFPAKGHARTKVIALHCSGWNAKQWRSLHDVLGPDFELHTPENYGTDNRGDWPGEQPFTLADEAAGAIEIIDASVDPVHLIGHSYGGALALHIALARPHKIASLAVYEPCAYHLLRQIGREGEEGFAEIMELNSFVKTRVAVGDYKAAMTSFVDYWNGADAWVTMRSDLQKLMLRWAPKAPLEFYALMEESVLLGSYSELNMPVLLLRGEHTPTPTEAIAGALAEVLPNARLVDVSGAGHMGHVTHADDVHMAIMDHLLEANRPPPLRNTA
ncbi:alpha/beta fold hydrolase [Denitrobaculum tricleocarpae]|uniref:Alpha/beta hydrolase n=1 Tax=Denitrobaculum tricleocarpae TaxID=2591009 RepID=A0A545U0N9_9PROT|nr:alpha/beta hydrolase [Denitrobaculum tricleocarpae]TQV83039.1 alpha/beta hydrolase [Denitrobaculum tricleocarpae]